MQYSILCNAAKYVKSGGVLIYSTCTVNQEENSMVCEKFLKEHSDFCLREIREPSAARQENVGITLLPQCTASDGFYLAKLMKK